MQRGSGSWYHGGNRRRCLPVRALVCPRMVEWNDRSPGQVCDNRYTRRSARPDQAILRRTGCQFTSAQEYCGIRRYRIQQDIPDGSTGTVWVHVNIRGDCRKGRDIPPCSRAGNGTQSHAPCRPLSPYHGGSWNRRVLSIHRNQGGIACHGKERITKGGEMTTLCGPPVTSIWFSCT